MRFTHLYAPVAVAFFLRAVPVTEARISRAKRDAVWVPSNPQAFEVKVSFDDVGRYLIPIGMGKPFSQAGNFSFLLSTSSGYTGVAAADCASCAAQIGQGPKYNISASISASRRDIPQAINLGGGRMSGALIYESCSFRKVKRPGGPGWAYDKQTVLMIQDTAGVLGSNVSGLVGFGRSTGNDSYVSGIVNTRGWGNATFGFALDQFNVSAAGDATTTQSAGSLTVGDLNSDLYDGEIDWQPVAEVNNVPANVPSDWAIKFDSYSLTFGNQTTTNTGGVAIIEPYFQEIRIPSKEATDFFGNIPNTTMTNDTMSLSWAVPCDQDVTFSITIGNNTYRIKKEQLITLNSAGTVCTSLVKGWADPAVRAFLLGTPFATSAFIAYDAQQDKAGDQIGVAPREGNTTIIIVNQGVSTAVLVAAIVGSLSGMAFLALLLLFFHYRRRRGDPRGDKPSARNNEKYTKEKYKVVPYTDGAPPNSATPILSAQTSQTRYIAVQGPIDGEPSEGSVLQHTRVGSLSSSQGSHGRERKRPITLPNLVIVRQSQITDSSVDSPSPTPSPHREVQTAVRRPPDVSLSRSLSHSFYGARIPSISVGPELEQQPPLSPVEPRTPVAPPPYSQAQRSARVAATPLSSLPEKV